MKLLPFASVPGTDERDRCESTLGCCEPLDGAGTRPFRLELAVLRRRGGHELAEQPPRRCRDLVDRAGERLLVRLRGLREAADLADVLERGRVDLLLRRGRLEVEEHMDVPAHVAILATLALVVSNVRICLHTTSWKPR